MPVEPAPPRGRWARWRHRGYALLFAAARALGLEHEGAAGTALRARSEERYWRIFWTVGSGLVARGAGALLALLTVPVLLAHLGREGFGLWNAILAATAWVAILDGGIAGGLLNRLARDHGRDDESSARAVVSTALAAVGLMTLIGGAVCLALAARADWEALLGAGAAGGAAGLLRWAALAAIAAQFLALPGSLAPQIFAAYQRGYLGSAWAFAGQGAAFLALVAAIALGASLPALLFAFLVAPGLVAAVAVGVAVRRVFPWLRPGLGAVSSAALLDVLRPAVPIFLFQVGGLVVSQAAIYLLARRADWLAVAEFSVLFRLQAFLTAAILLGTAAFLPPIREAAERGDAGWARRGVAGLLRVRLILAIGGALLFLLAGNPLVRLWVGRDDLVYTPRTWAIFAGMLIAVVWTSTWSEFLSIMDRIWPLVPVVFGNGIATVLLVWWWVPWHPVDGALAGSAAATVLILVWLLPRMSRQVLAGLESAAAVSPGEEN